MVFPKSNRPRYHSSGLGRCPTAGYSRRPEKKREMRRGQQMNVASAAADDRPIKVIRPTQSIFELLCDGLTSLVGHKSLFVEMTLLRLKLRYKQSLLGWIWAVVPPLLLMVTYTLIFSTVIGFKTGDLPVALF